MRFYFILQALQAFLEFDDAFTEVAAHFWKPPAEKQHAYHQEEENFLGSETTYCKQASHGCAFG
jgi:hypothetical protein